MARHACWTALHNVIGWSRTRGAQPKLVVMDNMDARRLIAAPCPKVLTFMHTLDPWLTCRVAPGALRSPCLSTASSRMLEISIVSGNSRCCQQ